MRQPLFGGNAVIQILWFASKISHTLFGKQRHLLTS